VLGHLCFVGGQLHQNIQKPLAKIAYFLLDYRGILTYNEGNCAKVVPFVFGGLSNDRI
jgi:hypothetical protein